VQQDDLITHLVTFVYREQCALHTDLYNSLPSIIDQAGSTTKALGVIGENYTVPRAS
jgi:hypothetical protein